MNHTLRVTETGHSKILVILFQIVYNIRSVDGKPCLGSCQKSQFKLDFTAEKKYHLRECSEYISLNVSGICHGLQTSRT